MQGTLFATVELAFPGKNPTVRTTSLAVALRSGSTLETLLPLVEGAIDTWVATCKPTHSTSKKSTARASSRNFKGKSKGRSNSTPTKNR